MFSFPKLRRRDRDRDRDAPSPAEITSPYPHNPYPSHPNPQVTLINHNASNSVSSLPTIVYGARSCTSLFAPPPSTISTLYPDDSASNIGLPKKPRPRTSSRHLNTPSASSAYEAGEHERDSYFHLQTSQPYHYSQHHYGPPPSHATGPASLTLAARSQAFLVRRPSTFHELDQDVSHLMAPMRTRGSDDRAMSPVALPQKALALLGLDERGSALGFGSPASPSPNYDDDTSDEEGDENTIAAHRSCSPDIHELYSPVVGEDALGIDAGLMGTATVNTPTTESALRSPATFMGDLNLERRRPFRFQHLNPPPPPDRLYFRPESLCSSFSTSSGRTGRSSRSRGSEETAGTVITAEEADSPTLSPKLMEWGWGGGKEGYGGPKVEVEVAELEGDFGAVELDSGTLTSESTVTAIVDTLSSLSSAIMRVDKSESTPQPRPPREEAEETEGRQYLMPGPSGRRYHSDGRNSNATNLGLGAMLNLDDSDSDSESESEIDDSPSSPLRPPIHPHRQPEPDSPILPPTTTILTPPTSLPPPPPLKPGELPPSITAQILSHLSPPNLYFSDLTGKKCPRCILHTLHALSLTSKSWSAAANKNLYTIIPLDLGTYSPITRTFTPHPTTCSHHPQSLSIEQRLPLLYRTLWDTPDTKPALVKGIKLPRGMFGVTKYPLSAILQKCGNLEFLDAATIPSTASQKDLGPVLSGLKNITHWTWQRSQPSSTTSPGGALDPAITPAPFPAITSTWTSLHSLTLDNISLPSPTATSTSPYPYPPNLSNLTLLNLPSTSLPDLAYLPKSLSSLTISTPHQPVTPHLTTYLASHPTLLKLTIWDTAVEFDSLIPYLNNLTHLELLGSGIEVSGALVGGSEFSLGFGDINEKVLPGLEWVKVDLEGGLTKAGVADFLVGLIKGGKEGLMVVVGKEEKGEEGEWGRVWGEGVWGGVEVRRGE